MCSWVSRIVVNVENVGDAVGVAGDSALTASVDPDEPR